MYLLAQRPYLSLGLVSCSIKEERRGGKEGKKARRGGRRKYALLQFPFTIIERAHIPRFEPAGDAVEMECVLSVLSVLGIRGKDRGDVRYIYPKRHYILRWLLILGSLGSRCL